MSTTKNGRRKKVLALNQAAPKTNEEALAPRARAIGRNKRRADQIEKLKEKIAGARVRMRREPKAKSQEQAPKKTGKKPKHRGDQDNG